MKNNSVIPFYPLLIFSFFIIFSFWSGCSKKDRDRSSNILLLDSLLNHTEDFTIERLKHVAEIKQKKRMAQLPSDSYFYNNLLYENFYTLDADSAFYYADQTIADAKASGNKQWITHSLINKANILAATGLLKGALDVMAQINPSELSKEELVEYYGEMVYLYSHLGNYAEGSQNDYYITERLYKDSVMSVIEPSHPEYLWYKSWDILGTNKNPDKVIEELETSLSNSELNERQDAKNAYALARLYAQKGDMDKYEHYMALSAIVDVKIANAEISSLEDLAQLMFQDGKGDIDRAYNYINYSLEKALDYPNRSKAFGISKTMEKINRAYQDKIERQQHHTRVFLILVCILAAILIIAVVDIILQNKKVKKQSKAVDEANEKLNLQVEALREADNKLNEMNKLLKKLNDDLTEKNDQLYEANFVKEEYIGYVFKLCSSYIADLEEFKRNIYLKAVKKQWKDIENISADIDLKGELKEFYHSFDSIFLNLYPNFVNEFNALLKPEKQIIPREGELLNTELRIYALVRLGISDSVKIADFLHCAPQTVYNYRLRTRSRSNYEKEDFLNKVRSIGSFKGKR